MFLSIAGKKCGNRDVAYSISSNILFNNLQSDPLGRALVCTIQEPPWIDEVVILLPNPLTVNDKTF
jgi:hypothetical protein